MFLKRGDFVANRRAALGADQADVLVLLKKKKGYRKGMKNGAGPIRLACQFCLSRTRRDQS